MTPESATDEQTMVPENADDDRSMTPESANDTAASTPEITPSVSQSGSATEQAPPQDNAAAQAAQTSTATNTVARAAPSGCWAKLYYADNFVGHSLTLLGPADVPDLEGTFRSVEVGPEATLTLFNEENFADQGGRYAPGQKAATLAEAPGLADFESLRITCTGEAPPVG